MTDKIDRADGLLADLLRLPDPAWNNSNGNVDNNYSEQPIPRSVFVLLCKENDRVYLLSHPHPARQAPLAISSCLVLSDTSPA